MTTQHRPPPTRFSAVTGTAQPSAAAGGYKLVVGAYMHQGPGSGNLPPALAGHAFVAVERPDGRRQAFGFSPQGYSGMDARRDFGRLSTGVQGKVHNDAQAFAQPGVRVTSVPISEGQARAALAKVAEYQSGRFDFSATRRQCTTFAADVAKAAGVSVGRGGNDPRGFYHSLQRRAGVMQGRFLQCKGDAFALPSSFNLPSGAGRPLPEPVREKMERFFGADFSGVRVHVGPEAPAIGALAFTVGETIVFAPGQYDPASPRGQQLLGHELAHVVQQRSGRVRNPFGNGLAVVSDPGLEAEADRLGMRAAWGG
ncbi:MAG: DUF4157 domain-containing protein [Magnetospirillum sp.]|nr:DUF4157 domain-containing protein [Magnetospirillum sp.]